jgi:integrase
MARNFTGPWVPTAEPGEHFDAKTPGLGLRVSPKGKRTWFLRAHTGNGRQVRRKLGEYPKMTLAKAREAAAIKWGEAKAGTLEEVRGARPMTFGEAAEEALAVMATSTRERTIRERRRILTHDLLPAWKDLPVDSVTRGDVVNLVNGIAKRGSPVMANRTLSMIRATFNTLLDLELVESNPATRPKRFFRPEKPRERALTPGELRKLLEVVKGQGPEARAFFGLALNTAQRAGAIAGARWEEFDMEARTWTIPPDEGRKFKKYPRVVPLNDGALRALQTLQTEKKAHSDLLFPARGGAKAPHFTGWHNVARRLREEAKVEGWSFHTFRATFRGLATRELRIRPDVADAILGHDLQTVGHVHYETDKPTFLLAEKQKALEAWAAFLCRLERKG